jgi:hypothetical protein
MFPENSSNTKSHQFIEQKNCAIRPEVVKDWMIKIPQEFPTFVSIYSYIPEYEAYIARNPWDNRAKYGGQIK